jgi:hypothetical protein
MTIRELKDILEKYDDNIPIVAYLPDKNYVVDIFIEPINVRNLGNYDITNRQNPQMHYEVEFSYGDEAVLVSVEPPKKRF